MRDFPIFTTEYGVSSLTLKEIPYKKEAYIRIRDVSEGFFGEHLSECVSFCRMAGADCIFAAGNGNLENYPLHSSVLEMRGTAWVDPEKLACLFPVTEATAARWRSIYNERMRAVDNAQTLEARDEAQIAQSGGAYFIHRDGQLLGIGWLEEGTKFDRLFAWAILLPFFPDDALCLIAGLSAMTWRRFASLLLLKLPSIAVYSVVYAVFGYLL